jgi:hypothetical protein
MEGLVDAIALPIILALMIYVIGKAVSLRWS